jgi:hypothetical protein
MKAIQIDFVRRKHWIVLWVLAAVAGLAMVTVWSLQYKELSDQRRSIASAAQQLVTATAPTLEVPKPPDPKSAQYVQAANMLQHDLNRVFTLIEVIKEPNSRLRNLSIDTASQQVRVDYELDSLARATSVTLSLNAGYIESPWRLESINATAPILVPGAVTPAGQYRAIWSSRLEKL